jgi:hypothetical protein
MYMPPTFLTLELATEIAAEFEWPVPYSLEDWRQDGIAMRFPGCVVLFEEGFESEMAAFFLPRDTGLESGVNIYHALIPRGDVDTPGIINYFCPEATMEKVQNGLRDLCSTLLHHFRSTLQGDFEWVPAYREYLERSREQH